MPAAARWVPNNNNNNKKHTHKTQPPEMRVGCFSFYEPVLEMRGAGREREAGGFPWVGFV